MNELPSLEHALYGSQDAGGYRFLARSPGFLDAWLPEAERLCTSFGERPAGVACPRAVFAQPFPGGQVVLVQAADQGTDDQGRPGSISFHLVVLPMKLYHALGGDPFHLAGQITPPWSSRGHLSPLECPKPAPRRMVEEVRTILRGDNSATLLGSTQALLDGGRVVFERSSPDETLLRNLWLLLPTASRGDYWPASFAFGNALGFHVFATPRIDPEQGGGYLTEEKAGDYPEGRYELSLQRAAETGDQDTLDGLFARHSYRQMRKTVIVLLVVVVLLAVMMYLLKPEEGLPGPEEFSPLTEAETVAFKGKLIELAGAVGVKLPPTPRQVAATIGADPLAAAGMLFVGWTPEELIELIDSKLGTPNPNRDPGPLDKHGPAKRRFRVLMWKHGVKQYNVRELSPPELVDALKEKLLRDRKEEP